MKLKYIGLLFFATLTCMSCDVQEDPAKPLAPFDRITSNGGGVTFTLVQGAKNKVISTSLNDAAYNVSNDQLLVNAASGTMTIAIHNLDLLWCNGCSVKNKGAIVVDTLSLYVHSGSVELKDLQVSNLVSLIALNTGTYKLSGNTRLFKFSGVDSTYLKAENFSADSVYIISQCAVDSDVYATDLLNAFIASEGNVNYLGNPPVIRVTTTGLGKAIKK